MTSPCRTNPTPLLSVWGPHPAWFGLLLLPAFSSAGWAAELSQARQLFNSGRYAECAETAVATISSGYHGEDWPLLKIEADMQLGRYADALQTLDAAVKNFRYGVRLRWLGYRVLLFNNLPDRAAEMLEQIADLSTRATYRYGDSANRVTLGKYYAHRGADPRRVLETFFDPVKRDQPQQADAFMAAGELALDKGDFALAAEEFNSALKRRSGDPDVHYGLARAYSSSSNEQTNEHLQAALTINPRHVPSLLLVVENHIDAEMYEQAAEVIQQVLDVNPRHPEAWAYRAVLAHLQSDQENEKRARQTALSTWHQNPLVDHLIGRKLSQKYLFKEGAQYQRRAVAFDKFFLPAQLQLSQDLLRLGEEGEGWQRAELVFDADQYNVVAHNLVRLRANLAKFETLQNDDFVVRMDAREAAIYGSRVLELLMQAKATLCQKYDVTIAEPITVEIFPRQQDFAIRTFGLPGGEGFLGVCFGRVITANSPASQGAAPSNLESVLWHEFCHVVTLQKTCNRMPRWLSEGISVYEERQADASWGQRLDPLYRQLILAGELTPVSKLSGAFLQPRSPLHLQFAYFESSLVVQYLVEKHGHEVLNRILTDLGVGMSINEALQRYSGSLEALDQEFEAYSRQQAAQLAPKLTWEEVDLARDAPLDQLASWVEQHPYNFDGLRRYARKLIETRRWSEAEEVLHKLIDCFPDYVGADNPYQLLAIVSRETNNVDQEKSMLEQWASRSDDDTATYLRLMELSTTQEDWEAVARNAERMLAVNPLVPAPHRYLSQAAEKLQDAQAASQSYRALLEMDPADPAALHYRLATHLHAGGEYEEAQRHVLMALDEAPRYRAAHQLLLAIHECLEDRAARAQPVAETAGQEGEQKRAAAGLLREGDE